MGFERQRLLSVDSGFVCLIAGQIQTSYFTTLSLSFPNMKIRYHRRVCVCVCVCVITSTRAGSL